MVSVASVETITMNIESYTTIKPNVANVVMIRMTALNITGSQDSQALLAIPSTYVTYGDVSISLLATTVKFSFSWSVNLIS